MRVNFRIKMGRLTFFTMLSTTQRLQGITSLIPEDPYKRHNIFWDIENCSLNQAEDSLGNVQNLYGLSNIYITSDKDSSYRGWCFSKVVFRILMKILYDTDYVDPNFIWWTNNRMKATLRIDGKKDRPPQQVVSVLETYHVPIPNRFERVIYDTGIEKRGHSILLGGRHG